MAALLDLLQSLFDSSFMPHGQCYLWQPGLVWLQAGSNALIALAYFLIPPAILWFVRKRDDLAFKWMFGLFGAFIMLCGMTHLMSVWTIWNGTYWIDGSIRLATGLVSMATAVLLFPLVPRALDLPTPTELRRANEELEAEVEQRKAAEAELAEKAEQLEEAYDQLKETERLKTQFFANVSHELRTPLTLILSPLEAILDETASETEAGLAPRYRRRMETAHNNSVRMLQMVNGLLDFSRLEIRQIEVDREPTDLPALTRSVTEDFEPLIEENALRLHLDAEIADPLVELDRYLYERILFNLLSNAVKFTPEGGSIDVGLEQEDDRLTLRVTDTGIGIKEDQLEEIFRDFRQVEASATRRFEGTGLGLPLVKEFTELLGGSVTVESTYGEGSTFTVRLEAPVSRDPVAEPTDEKEDTSRTAVRPLSEASERAPDENATAETSDLPTIVLAEDNEELAAYVEDLLADTCRIERARDGVEALELVERVDPELVLTDIMMPRKDGLEVCRTLKSRPDRAELPVVMLTALTDREALLEGWKAGADEYLFKPFHPKEVVTRIQTLLEHVERRKQAEAERKRLQEELLEVSEAERRRIGRELHDRVASHLSGTAMLAGELVADAEAERTSEPATTREVRELVQEAAEQARALAHGLNPVKLDGDGLAAALQRLAERQERSDEADCRFDHDDLSSDLDPEASSNLYRIAEEAVHNAVRHGNADRITIRLEQSRDDLILTIQDDGVGFDPAQMEKGLGLRTMRYRADQLEARLAVEASRGNGTTVQIWMPV